MKIVITSMYHTRWERIELEFESKVPVNLGTFYSFDGLVTLKDIENEVLEHFGLTKNKVSINPGFTRTTVSLFDEKDYERIKTIMKRDNIIENILKG